MCIFKYWQLKQCVYFVFISPFRMTQLRKKGKLIRTKKIKLFINKPL